MKKYNFYIIEKYFYSHLSDSASFYATKIWNKPLDAYIAFLILIQGRYDYRFILKLHHPEYILVHLYFYSRQLFYQLFYLTCFVTRYTWETCWIFSPYSLKEVFFYGASKARIYFQKTGMHLLLPSINSLKQYCCR